MVVFMEEIVAVAEEYMVVVFVGSWSVCEAEKRDGYGKQRKEGGSSVSINARPETESERESEQPRRAKNMKGGAKHYHQHQETRNFQDFLFFKSDH